MISPLIFILAIGLGAWNIYLFLEIIESTAKGDAKTAKGYFWTIVGSSVFVSIVSAVLLYVNGLQNSR